VDASAKMDPLNVRQENSGTGRIAAVSAEENVALQVTSKILRLVDARENNVLSKIATGLRYGIKLCANANVSIFSNALLPNNGVRPTVGVNAPMFKLVQQVRFGTHHLAHVNASKNSAIGLKYGTPTLVRVNVTTLSNNATILGSGIQTHANANAKPGNAHILKSGTPLAASVNVLLQVVEVMAAVSLSTAPIPTSLTTADADAFAIAALMGSLRAIHHQIRTPTIISLQAKEVVILPQATQVAQVALAAMTATKTMGMEELRSSIQF